MLTPEVSETTRAGHFAEFLVGHTFVGTGLGEALPASELTRLDHARIAKRTRDRVSASVLLIPDIPKEK